MKKAVNLWQLELCIAFPLRLEKIRRTAKPRFCCIFGVDHGTSRCKQAAHVQALPSVQMAMADIGNVARHTATLGTKIRRTSERSCGSTEQIPVPSRIVWLWEDCLPVVPIACNLPKSLNMVFPSIQTPINEGEFGKFLFWSLF